MQEWQRWKDHPVQIAANRAAAALATQRLIEPKEGEQVRKQFEQEAFEEFSAPPRLEKGYSLKDCLGRAFADLLNEGLDTPDDDLSPYDLVKAKAVLFITWLLTDKEADKHPLAAQFGKWGDSFEEQMELKGRALARLVTLDELNAEARSTWMNLARVAWRVLQAGHQSTGAGQNDEPPAATPRLIIKSEVATLDGDPYQLSPDAAEILQKLLEANGRPVSSTDMKFSEGSRPDRVIKRMPPEIRAIIRSKPGTGYWLAL
jgi:hypothetical protein